MVSGTFVLDGTRFIGINGGPQFPFTEAVSFLVECNDQDEVDYYWVRLVDGGEESQCGWLKDRFGLSWQIVPTRLFELIDDPDPARAAAATKAMLGMRKIVIAELEAAVAAPERVPQLVRRSIHSIVASVIGPTSATSSQSSPSPMPPTRCAPCSIGCSPTLPIVLANLVSIGEVAVTYQPSLEQLLVLLPQGTATTQAIGVAQAQHQTGRRGRYA